MRAKGIDISRYQLSFEYQDNLDFIIVKISEGCKQYDWWLNFRQEILKVPIRGAYHYFRTSIDPIIQGELFLDAVAGTPFHFLVVDYETTGNVLDRQGAENLLRCLKHIRNSVEIPVLVYTNEYTYRDNMRIWREEFDDFPFWVARYSEVEPGGICERSWTFWQWTNSADGTQVGVGSEHVDRDVYNGTAEQLKQWLDPEIEEETDMKKWYQSKTLWFSILFALVNVAGIFGFAEFVPGDEIVQYVNIGVSLIVALLRVFTKQGVEL